MLIYRDDACAGWCQYVPPRRSLSAQDWLIGLDRTDRRPASSPKAFNWRLTGRCLSAAPRRGLELVLSIAVVVGIESYSGSDELVDVVKDLDRQRYVRGGQVRLELVHGARPDDRGGDGKGRAR